MRNAVLVCSEVFIDDRIDAMSQVFKGKKNTFQTVGWLVFVWACVLEKHPSGILGYGSMAKIALEGLSGSLKPKADVVRSMIDTGLLRLVDSETVEVVGWGDWTGSIPKKRKRKAERQKRYRRKSVGASAKNEQNGSSQDIVNAQDTHVGDPKCRRLHGQNVDVYIAQPTENKELSDESCRRLRSENVDVYADGTLAGSGEPDINRGVEPDSPESVGQKSHLLGLDNTNLYNYNYNSISKIKDQLVEPIKNNSIDSIKNSLNSDLNCLNKKKKKKQKKEKSPGLHSATVSDVESGVSDAWPAKVSFKHCDVLSAFASVHGDCWGTKFKPESQAIRKMAKQIILDDGYSPSDVCKAIRGMTHDTWADRRKFSGWTYLAKHFEKWLTMYSDGTSQAEAGSWGPWRDEGFATREDWEKHHGKR